MTFSSGALAVMPAMTSTTKATPDIEVKSLSFQEEKRVVSRDYQPISDPKNVEKFIADYFADIPIMARIAKCESRNRHLGKDGLILRGELTPLDRGVMQVNLYYHEDTALKMGLDLHDIDDNVAYARYLYQKQGTKPWMSSSKCWSKPVSPEIAKK